MAKGLRVFRTMEQATAEGYQLYDRLASGGYLVRTRTDAGWAIAIVDPNCDDKPLPDIADPDREC